MTTPPVPDGDDARPEDPPTESAAFSRDSTDPDGVASSAAVPGDPRVRVTAEDDTAAWAAAEGYAAASAAVAIVQQRPSDAETSTGAVESAGTAAGADGSDDGAAPLDSAPEDSDLPDIGFAIAEEPADLEERARRLSHTIARELAAIGPAGWLRLEGVFALTVGAEMVQVFYFDESDRSVRVHPEPELLTLVREYRHLSAELGDGPWWRMLLTLTNEGVIEVDHDYGDEPFPEEQLFPAEVYAADLEVYPRANLPVWLAAYLRHGDRQSRPARAAAAQARADREADVRAVRSEGDFPALPVLWGRWAVMSAAFVAAGSPWGPRILPALGFFEGSRRSGSTLYVLPGGRAVLSGGVWNAERLDATYNGGHPAPLLYSGAPAWVANPVLNPRAGNGLLSFCYWWEAGEWYRGDSPGSERLVDALPGIWTTETVVAVICDLFAEQPDPEQRAAVDTLVSAAEVGVVTRDTLVEVFGDIGDFDIDSAYYQLTMAGVTLAEPEPMPRAEAIARVRRYVTDSGAAGEGYPLDELRADRIDIGWMVYAPTRPDEIAVGRAIFYIADDGVLEQSSSSVAPSIYVAEFERRFQQRHGSVGG